MLYEKQTRNIFSLQWLRRKGQESKDIYQTLQKGDDHLKSICKAHAIHSTLIYAN